RAHPATILPVSQRSTVPTRHPTREPTGFQEPGWSEPLRDAAGAPSVNRSILGDEVARRLGPISARDILLSLGAPRGQPPMPRAVPRRDPDRDPIGPFLHFLMADCGVSPNTLAAYRSDITRFARWRKSHASGPIAALNVADLAGYVDYLGQC